LLISQGRTIHLSKSGGADNFNNGKTKDLSKAKDHYNTSADTQQVLHHTVLLSQNNPGLLRITLVFSE
jgi:hypothetical protein